MYPDVEEAASYVVPDENTVTEFRGIKLLQFNVCVNIQFRSLVCMQCEGFLSPPWTLKSHVHDHLRGFVVVPDNLDQELITEYNLANSPVYPAGPTSPVYGLPLHRKRQFFCSQCHLGYSNPRSLRQHQRGAKHTDATSYQSYAQYTSRRSRKCFPVNIANVPRIDHSKVEFEDLDAQITPASDPSQRTLQLVQDSMVREAFYHNEGWLEHVAGHTFEHLYDAQRHPLPNIAQTDPRYAVENLGKGIKHLSLEFLKNIQPRITEFVSFGVTDVLAFTMYASFSSSAL